MATVTERNVATIEDLYRTPGKAELVDGQLQLMAPTGGMPGRAAMAITMSLREHEKRTCRGYALGDNVGFLVDLPNRRSFSPDAAFWTGPPPSMKFFDGAPVFAAEIRSKGDYGVKAERQLAAKRLDYFAAGTLVVWDVDLQNDDVIRIYRRDNPDAAVGYRRGQTANAEPAVLGWTMAVNDLFD